MAFLILQYLQLLVGLVLTALFVAAPFLMPSLYPDVQPALFAFEMYSGDPNTLMLLATGCVNLMAGFYLKTLPAPRSPLQGLASLSFLSAGVLCAANVLMRLYVDPLIPNVPEIIIALILAGIGLHTLCNLYLLNPANMKKQGSQDGEDSNREYGLVKWFNVSKGFGFITRDTGEDIFVHYRAIRGDGHRALNEGQRVHFTVAHKDKGLQAEDVVVQQK